MPTVEILIDTDILIDVSRNITKAVELLDSLKKQYVLSISVITQIELLNGCRNRNEQIQVQNFLDRFEIIHISEAISVKTVELFERFRLSHGVKIPDMLIAATAIEYQTQLVSKNKKDFIFIDELNFVDY